MQLIASSKETSEGLSKELSVDIPESSSKTKEFLETEVPAAEIPQTEFDVAAVDAASHGKAKLLLLIFIPLTIHSQ